MWYRENITEFYLKTKDIWLIILVNSLPGCCVVQAGIRCIQGMQFCLSVHVREKVRKMEFAEVVHTRRSIRGYTNKAVSEEMIDTVIRAAMAAPSAGNQQPWHFIVIRDRKNLDQIPSFHPYAKMVQKCRVAVLICGDPEGKKWPAFWPQDCSAAAQNLLLSARSQGLGTVWAGVYPDERRMAGFRKLLKIPGNIWPFALIPIGWPDSEFQQMDRYNKTLIHRETW